MRRSNDTQRALGLVLLVTCAVLVVIAVAVALGALSAVVVAAVLCGLTGATLLVYPRD